MSKISISVRDMLAAGFAALRRYPGLVLALYLVQLAVAGLAGLVIARILALVFARQPLFDQAVAGELRALALVVIQNREIVTALSWVGLGAVLGYALLSWYLIGGLNAVLLEAPRSRQEVARTFGAGGAATFFSYLRLALWTLIPYVVALVAVMMGLGRGARDAQYWLTPGEALGALVPALMPGAILLWLVTTAVDYARIQLSQNPSLAAWRALLSGMHQVMTGYRPLVHALLYVLFFVAVSAIYVTVTAGRPMSGAAGAVTILLARQAVLLIRFAGAIACAAGQVALARAGAKSASMARNPGLAAAAVSRSTGQS